MQRVRSTQKLPIVFAEAPGEAADQRDRERDAGRRREEVLNGEAEHLHEIAHRALAAIVLPVGVGDEADGGVEAEIFGHGRSCLAD